MKIELLRTVGQLFTFRADDIDKIGYREIDLSASVGALDRYKMKDTGEGEFSISTKSPAVEAVIELKVGENEYVFTGARFCYDRSKTHRKHAQIHYRVGEENRRQSFIAAARQYDHKFFRGHIDREVYPRFCPQQK